MIEEAYCSFEVAKLLKEKGFDEECYNIYDNEGYLSFNHVGYINSEKPSEDFYALAPTHQMAMKWLREVYKISIDICTVQGRKVSYMFNIWDFSIIQSNKYIGGTFDLREQLFDFETYEEAVEAALKYSLEKLI